MISHDRPWHDAGRLMKQRNIPTEGHQALQENLSTYLAHRDEDDGLSPRWQSKLTRDLEEPYRDEQVEQRLDVLQESLKENLQQLPGTPGRVYLTGSFARGRLGGNSDLDGLVEVADEHLDQAFDVLECRIDKQDAAALIPIPADEAHLLQAQLMAQGASIAIEPERIDGGQNLREVYKYVKSKRQQRRETSPIFEAVTQKIWREDMDAKDKRELLSGRSLKSMALRQALRVGGCLSTAPLVGPVMVQVVDGVVEQNHMVAP